MHRFAGAALLTAAAGAVGFLAAGGPREAAASPPPGAVEYRVILVDFEDYKGLEEYKALETEMKSPWRAQFAFQEKVLNRAGAEGFDLVQVVVPKTPSTSILYLKRPAAK